jgi:hypothetical protein
MEPIALKLPGSSERGCTFAGGLTDVPPALLDAFAAVVVHGPAGLRLVLTGTGRVRGLDAAAAAVERVAPESLYDAVTTAAAERPLDRDQAAVLAELEATAVTGSDTPAVGRQVAAGLLLLLLALKLR